MWGRMGAELRATKRTGGRQCGGPRTPHAAVGSPGARLREAEGKLPYHAVDQLLQRGQLPLIYEIELLQSSRQPERRARMGRDGPDVVS